MKDLINKIKNVVYKGLRFLNQCQHANKFILRLLKLKSLFSEER